MNTTTTKEAFLASPQPSFKHTTYFAAYDQLFEKYRGKDITFVEVGILNGGSLFMWREYFGPKARIIGIDLNPGAKKWEAEGFEIFIGSQSDPSFWNDFTTQIGKIDLLLDDGGHTFIQQIVTCEAVLDSIADCGLLVVEDTHTSYIDGFGDRKKSFINYTKTWIDKINSRFSKFGPERADKRVWSIEIFESIVAFKVNRAASHEKSLPIWNMPPEERAFDYRDEDAPQLVENKEEIDSIMNKAFQIYHK